MTFKASFLMRVRRASGASTHFNSGLLSHIGNIA